MFLGALFGYLYYWSGNLIVPMFAHFFNNFVAVSSIYFGLSDIPGMEIDKPEAPPWYVVFIMTVVCGLLIFLFHRQFPKTSDKSIAVDDVRA
jgi:membrane protease YdiL (CAAX protease family)